MGQEISLDSLLGSAPAGLGDIGLSFPNLGQVAFTSITWANLLLLDKVRDLRAPGLLVSCPDFEREAVSIAFMAALRHLQFDCGELGSHEARVGEKAAIGDLVVEITDIKDKEIHYNTLDQSLAQDSSIREFPLVHLASPKAPLSRTKSTKKRKYPSLWSEARRYEELPSGLRAILDSCGKSVPAIGYVSSPSPYANDAPTHILSGQMFFDGVPHDLSRCVPVTYLSVNGQKRNSFAWPFDCPPSVLVAPRVDGVGSAVQIADEVDAGHNINFVSFNISGPELMNTSLLSDILDLVDSGVGVIGFCDRWTLNRLGDLIGQGFLPFDWGDCKDVAKKSKRCVLSPVQKRTVERQHEIVLSVQDGDTGLFYAQNTLYGLFGAVDTDDDDFLQAEQSLFGVLGAAIRMTEAPDERYCDQQTGIITDSLETIRQSRLLGREDFSELEQACAALRRIIRPGNRMPKEQQIYDLVTRFLNSELPVVLVVDRNRATDAYRYWHDELVHNGYDPRLFSVMTTRDYFSGHNLNGDEYVIFSGWYGSGIMDRALHSGMATNLFFVLYGHESGGLELEWWLNASERWRGESDRCRRLTNATLTKLGIETLNVSERGKFKTVKAHTKASPKGEFGDSPITVMTKIETRRIQQDLARSGEKSVPAVPVMFHDGTHVWLKADANRARGGRLLVINGCLDGQDEEPDQKLALALLPGDVVLRTHSDRDYIRKTSEQTTTGYDDVLALAQKWKTPIKRARSRGLADAEIVERIYAKVSETRTKQGVRGWVKGQRIAPQTPADIEAIYEALGYPITDDELSIIAIAVRKIRNKHRAVGRIAAKGMVADFLKDVRQYGLDDAIDGFDQRHEAGDVELLRVTAVGQKKNVAVDRVDVL